MPTSIRWQVPIELSPDEARVAATLHRIGKFYVFLRTVRAELFDEAFQAELAAVYAPRGTEPLPAALLAMVTVLQAYEQVGDAEAVVAAALDPRWQLVLGCLGAHEAPFSQGALVTFRERMIAHDLDQQLLDRTVAVAKQTEAMLHLYVDDLEGTIQRALDLGATSTYPITQASYGERFGVVEDPAGNAWIIAERATSTLRHPDMRTVTPYLNPKGAADLIEFLKAGLGAEQIERHDHPPRGVVHCKMRLGQSFLELGDPEEAASAFPVMFYLYVASADATYERALKAGAVSIHPPAKQHYGEYVAAFTDPAGNQWYVAEHRVDI